MKKLKNTGAYAYLFPSFLIFGIFLFYPFFKTLYLSLFKTNKMGQAKLFVGLGNYKELLQSSSFWNSLAVTLIFVVIVVAVSMILGLTTAVLCNKTFPGIRFFSTAYALPMAIASSSAAMIFKIMLHPSVGIINKIFHLDINWVSDPKYALICVAVLTAWLNSGINFLYFSAGLSNIDETIYERASVDGASSFQKFYRLTLPGLAPMMFYTLVVNIIQAFQSFGQVKILTQGGPGESTNLIVYSIYRDAFFNYRFGSAAAQSVVLFLIVLVLTLVMFKKRSEILMSQLGSITAEKEKQMDLERQRFQEVKAKMLAQQKYKRAARTAGHIVLNIVVALIVLLPLLYAVSIAFMPSGELFTLDMNILPKHPTLENFRQALQKVPLVRFVVNSFLVAGLITFGQIISCSLAAFSFSFLDFKGKNVLFMLVMATMMIPGEATIISNYLTVSGWNWLDSYQVLIVPYLTSAMGIFLFRQFYLTFPISLYESAKIDGCSNLRFIWQILMPLTKSAMGAMAVYTFINAWNMYMWPLLVIGSDKMRTVQIGIGMLDSVDSQSITLMIAGVVLIILPSISIFIAGQKQLIRGMFSGAVKG